MKVLGHLPVRYRLWVAVAGLLTFALVGAWLGFAAEVTPSWPMMTAVGIVLGLVFIVVFLRAMSRRPGEAPTEPRHGS